MDEAKKTSGWTEAQCEVIEKLIMEARTTSELPELLRTAFSTKLLDGYEEHIALWPQVFDVITMTKGNTIDIPGLKGIHVYEAVSGEEKDFTGPIGGEAKMAPRKYECLIGFTEEMLEDAEVDVMGWCLRKIGHRFKQKEDEIAFTALTTRGGSMAAGAGGLTAAGLQAAYAALLNRTVTAGGRTEREPITPDTIVVDPTHLYTTRELINTTLTVAVNTAAGTGNAGSNVFQNILNIVCSPYIDDDYYYVGKAKTDGGAIFLRRLELQIKNWEDLLRDTENVRAKARFDADILEPDKWCRTAY